uniref:Transposable element Tcb1 transposase n=1 Tax=Bactrocera latifrons TaxID=174628 RepID=A0A0K8VUT2_BACLA
MPTVKHGGGGAMVWGCMAGNGVGRMEFIESTTDKYAYLSILKRNLKQSVEELGLGSDYYFQHDNDPKYTADVVKLWLLYNVPKQLRMPPQSPDLNPIEHLWYSLERKIRQRTITSKAMLKDVLHEEWTKISPTKTSKLVYSMPKRLAEVLKRRGYPTFY